MVLSFVLGSLTVGRILPHTEPKYSCSARSPSAARPLAAAAQRFPFPGRRRAPWSGSPSAFVRHGNVWLPRCSSFSWTSICRPGRKQMKNKVRRWRISHINSIHEGPAGYLLVVWNKDFLGLLDHWLRLQLLLRKLVLAWVEQLPPRHAGQDEVCGIWLEMNVHLNGFWVNGGWSVAFFTTCKGGRNLMKPG